jgi:excisionase family DNA binding protein
MHAASAILATRIGFMNELAGLSERVGADIERVRQGIGTDPRIGLQFLDAGAGHAGSYFPKDVTPLASSAADAGCPLRLLLAVMAGLGIEYYCIGRAGTVPDKRRRVGLADCQARAIAVVARRAQLAHIGRHVGHVVAVAPDPEGWIVGHTTWRARRVRSSGADGADQASRNARLSAQLHLASVADSLMASLTPAHVDRMLSTVEAAEIMACSRPYVAMLIDSGKLAGATKTSGGHRKVSLASVEAWIASRRPSPDKDYREAGKAAGIYGVEEVVVMKAARREPARTRG